MAKDERCVKVLWVTLLELPVVLDMYNCVL